MTPSEFDKKWPKWYSIIGGKPEPYNDTVHQHWKHTHRAEIARLKATTTTCPLCDREAMLVADFAPDGRLRGVVCRRCRPRLLAFLPAIHSMLPDFWADYCQVHCRRVNKPDADGGVRLLKPGQTCDTHSDLVTWWEKAAIHTDRPLRVV